MEGLDQVFGASYNPGNTQVGESKSELGQDDFFRLMVAQLNNQDPTKPLDNTEFLGQLAQFSTVSGIGDMNESFSGLVNNLFTSQAMMAAQLIDREVLIDSGNLISESIQSGGEISGGIAAPTSIDGARVNILNAAGSLVNSIEMGRLEAGEHQFTWNGKAADGSDADSGTYMVVAEGYMDGQLMSLPLQKYSHIESVSVDRESTSVLLHLDNGESITFSQVNEFR